MEGVVSAKYATSGGRGDGIGDDTGVAGRGGGGGGDGSLGVPRGSEAPILQHAQMEASPRRSGRLRSRDEDSGSASGESPASLV